MARIESEDEVVGEYDSGHRTMLSNSIRVIGDWLEIANTGMGHRPTRTDGIERS